MNTLIGITLVTDINSEVIVVRLARRDVRDIDRMARARRQKRSEFIRGVLKASLGGRMDLEHEAARQSRLASLQPAEASSLEFIDAAMATDGWK